MVVGASLSPGQSPQDGKASKTDQSRP